MDKIFSVKDVAVKLEVTRQTVYNHIDKNFESLKGEIKKIQGITYLTIEGVRILKESMGLLQVPAKEEKIDLDAIIKEISENIKLSIKENMEDTKKDYNKLEDELEEVKKQNEIIQEQNKILLEKINNLVEIQQEKKGFFNIFKRK